MCKKTDGDNEFEQCHDHGARPRPVALAKSGKTAAVTIETTQWFRYWSGRVRSALATVLLTAELTAGKTVIHGNGTVSLCGGPITGTEKVTLPGLINGTVADLSTRDLDIDELRIKWLHFESLDDFLKALQGFGGIDFGGAMDQRPSSTCRGSGSTATTRSSTTC